MNPVLMIDTSRVVNSSVFTRLKASMYKDAVIESVLTEALGSHVMSVLCKYPERAAEYLSNWETECRIYHDRCVVTRRGEIIAEGAF